MKTYQKILREVFDFENKKIQKQGGIKVEWKSKLKKFGGATVADGGVLREITGKSTFPEKDWDKVLKQISKFGLDLIRVKGLGEAHGMPVIGRGFIQVTYDQITPEIKALRSAAKKAGFRVSSSSLGPQVTNVGMIKLKMLTINGDDFSPIRKELGKVQDKGQAF